MSDKIDEDAATFTATHTKKEVDLAQKLWLEKPNKHMSDTLVTNYDEVQELKGQLAELRKDKERLDWLLDENSCNHIERGRYNRLGDWLVKTLHNRSDIDKEMEEL